MQTKKYHFKKPELISSVTKGRAVYRCHCGKTWETSASDMNQGKIKSCGCYIKHFPAHTTHGLSKTPEYSVWLSMKARCYNKNYCSYKRYGGRGIKVSKRWNNFMYFYLDMGKRPSKKYSIERINNNGNYTKSNCKWVLFTEQSKNRSTNVKITINNKTNLLSEWLIYYKVSPPLYHKRLQKGISRLMAITTPVKKYRAREKDNSIGVKNARN